MKRPGFWSLLIRGNPEADNVIEADLAVARARLDRASNDFLDVVSETLNHVEAGQKERASRRNAPHSPP